MYKYNWTLRDAKFTKDKGKVFSCFSCGGGSTMGYKLAGFDVIGCNEIDPKMMEVYIKNHNPKYPFLAPVQEFKNYDFPADLYELDILDGSPPCSSFSMAGARERDWGKEKKFKEGQAKQVLDTLFFDFIDLAERLQPKVVIAENVKGILLGKAKKYIIEIYKRMDKAGYYLRHFLLDASKMGVPQRRERVFFIGLRKDLASKFLYQKDMFTEIPRLEMDFRYKEINAGEIIDYKGPEIQSEKILTLWENRRPGEEDQRHACRRIFNRDSYFGQRYIYADKVCSTLLTKKDCLLHSDKPLYLSKNEVCKISTFPVDYDFGNLPYHYVCGMSVPPVMTARIAEGIYKQWLGKI